jgi:hypothetical protein
MRKLGMICSIFVMAWLLFVTSCVTREVPTVETYYETEYRTEYRTETYTETVDAVIESKQGKKYLSPKIKWHTDLIASGFEGSGGTYYYGYQLDTWHPNAQVEIRISPVAQQQKGLVRVYDLTGIGQIPPRPTPFKEWYMGPYPEELSWLNTFNYLLSTARLLGEVRTGTGTDDSIVFDADGITEFGILSTTWNFYSISSVRLTWVDEIIGKTTVTKERQVPYQVPYQVEKQRTVTKTQKVPVWEIILGR